MEFICPNCETVWFTECLKCGSMDIGKDMRCRKCNSRSLNDICPICYCPVNWAASGNACVISTACVSARNLPDDCHELQTLRFWRDRLTHESADFRQYCEQYYKNSPKIVESIKKSPDHQYILDELYIKMVKQTVQLLESNQIDKAIENYKRWYEALCEQFL